MAFAPHKLRNSREAGKPLRMVWFFRNGQDTRQSLFGVKGVRKSLFENKSLQLCLIDVILRSGISSEGQGI